MDAESVVRPVVESAGYELFELAFVREQGRQVLRVTVDGDEAPDLDVLSALSEKVSRRLDLEDFGRGRYELEVSTPGIERPLKTAAHFRRVIGSTVKVKTAGPVEGARVHEGTLVVANGDHVRIEIAGRERSLPLDEVVSARTVIDWAAELKGSTT